ncbi:MAG TPA: FAD-linked oxidase C-terminal domain-containing protein [Casimicrobiaceae bacterium]|nr:FAD-linked oxidase C-terminal domain-containing protein [Casimicrobiaceae bacterium]
MPFDATTDSAALASRLRATIRGEVRFDDASRALYATDGSNYRQVPIGVVIPTNIDDVVATVAACREHGAPVLPRGGGTSLAGQCCNVAVVMDMSKYLHRIVALDAEGKRARVQPGTVLDDLRGAAEKHHLTFAPDPSTHSHNTLGGMICNNSCGVHSVMGGKTSDNVIELEVLTYDGLRLTVGPTAEDELERIIGEGGRRGEIYAGLKRLRDRYGDEIRARFPKIPRRVSGYGLDELLPENGCNVARALVGSEGTCVTILEATVRLVDSPPGRSLLVLGYPDVYSAGDHVPEILAHQPIGLEGIDDRLISDMKAIGLHPHDVSLLPEGGGWLLAEFGGANRDESHARARACMDAVTKAGSAPSMKLFDDPVEERMIWKVREAGLGATAHVPNKTITWEGWEDAAVPPDKVGAYLRDFRKLLEHHGYACDLYGHFGQGCIHTRIDFDLETRAGIEIFMRFLNDAADLVVRYGGSLSGEHGDGQSKAMFLPKMFGADLVRAFGEFKAIWDPAGKMNPGKVVDAYRPDQNLRLGTGYNPPQVVTHFKFPADAGNFGRVMLRCVGIGNCRQEHGQTMCPSYRVTREEKHSTRGRARLMFEMMHGDVLKGGWRDDAVRDALDLCLACKGCKGDCPVSVDMASYKAEFLSHYYEGRLRPRHAYVFGRIDRWAALAAAMPGAVNFMARAPVLRDIVKSAAGMPRERQVPTFARQTLRAWFRQRAPRNADKPAVMLWPDTFNNYFHPQVGQHAVAVLEAAGFRVVLPKTRLCCGRPLYDFGMLDQAEAYLRKILTTLRAEIDGGMPFVVLEPACAAVFRDELMNLFPGDEVAKRLSKQTYFFSEFVDRHLSGLALPLLERHAVVHGHCHQKALLGLDSGKATLAKAGLDADILDAGCCGMAGSFGFEKDKYEISKQIGELVLLPAVRAAATDSLIVADGFSCREQIAQCTGRRALHLAEVLHMALDPAAAGAVAATATA